MKPIKKNSLDLTQGNIVRMVLLFAMPIFLGQVLQNLYSSVDSIIVGRCVGTTALAAVSSSGDIAQLLIGFFVGLSSGAGVLFAHYFGAKSMDQLHNAIHTALTFSLILGVVLSLLGVIFTPALLQLVHCPANVWDEAVSYLRVYLVGILFTSIYNICASVLQSVGDSRTPLMILAVSSCINIVLDFVLVAWLKLSVTGAALATVFSQATSVIIVLRKMLTTQDVYRLHPARLRINVPELVRILKLALPSAIQSSLTSISNLFVQRYINSFGSTAMAGIGAGKKIERFAGLMGSSIGLSAATVISQNVGAKKLDRTFHSIRICLLLSIGASVIFAVPTYIFARELSQIFTKDPQAIHYTVGMLHTMLPLFFFNSLHQVFSSALRGFGHSRDVMILSLLGMIGFRQAFLLILSGSSAWSVTHLYLSFPVGWIAAAALVIIDYCIKVRRKYKKGELTGELFSH